MKKSQPKQPWMPHRRQVSGLTGSSGIAVAVEDETDGTLPEMTLMSAATIISDSCSGGSRQKDEGGVLGLIPWLVVGRWCSSTLGTIAVR
ncbi:hypothetical protein J5N97_009809 [Dioscorea zingiberensis]|uniref:Uncharacterized protein n=1 Tax=Dioscorea zingiberensis TaxID=325984 RepID=A0A9D5CYX1_9LILI|nr:hypothetical protein J5N97_009809 [Dioscorea zingiberensis]